METAQIGEIHDLQAPKREKLDDHSREVLTNLEKKINHPLFSLFTLVASGDPVDKDKFKTLFYEACVPRGNSDLFATLMVRGAFGNDNPNLFRRSLNYSQEEIDVITAVFDKQIQERKPYVTAVTQRSQGYALAIHTFESLSIPQDIAQASQIPYREAERKAYRDLEAVYGTNASQLLATNPNIRRQFQRNIVRYENSPYNTNYEKQKAHVVTDDEKKTTDLQKALTIGLLKDCVNIGIPFYGLLDKEQPRADKSTHKITPEMLKDLEVDDNLVIRYKGKHLRFLNESTLDELIKTGISKHGRLYDSLNHPVFTKIIDGYINIKKDFTPNELIILGELKLRNKMLFDLEHIETIGNIGKYFKEDPGYYIDYYYIDKAEVFDEDTIVRYIKSYVLLHPDVLNTLELSKLYNPEPTKPNTSFDRSINKLMRVLQFSTQANPSSEVMSHTYASASADTVGSLQEVLRDLEEIYTKPHFVIKGHPWRHMRALNAITELSSYPDDTGLPFSAYEIPESDPQNQLYISSMRPVSVGIDQDGVIAGKIYTTEFARLTSLSAKTGEEPLLFAEDYTLEYERKTGHYRMIYTPEGKTKIEQNNGVISYTVGIDPERNMDKTPPIGVLSFSNTQRISEFSSMLQENGYTATASELTNLLEKKQGHPVTSAELERAIQQGMRYVFGISESAARSSFRLHTSFAYLPPPDTDGYAQVQCIHAATLYSDLMNYITETSDFHPSTMLKTVRASLGQVFAGAPHSDTRGNLDVMRIRHDATPGTNIQNLKDIQVEQSRIIDLLSQRVIAKTLPERATELSRNFIQKVLSETPKTPQGKIVASQTYPEAVTTVTQMLHILESDTPRLLQDTEMRQSLIQQLENSKNQWQLALQDQATFTPVQKRAYTDMFGSFARVAPDALFAVDSALTFLKAA